MKFCDQIRRIESLDYLVQTRATGTSVELAQKLRLSPSQLYQTINTMKKDFGAPIYYSQAEQSYGYEKKVKFTCAFKEIKNS